MRPLWLTGLLLATALSGANAGAAGFEGLRPDGADPVKGQSGTIAALDAEHRTLRVGGNTFEVPQDFALDFETLHAGDRVVVHYHERSGRLLLSGLERKSK